MANLRDSDALLRARRALFEAFPETPTAKESLAFQKLLIEEIVRTEGEQRADKSPERAEHLRGVRAYGDALAHFLFSRYALRQFARNPGRPPSLSGQGKAFDMVVDSATLLADSGIPPLIADLTHVVRIGDVLGCVDKDRPLIFECKSGEKQDPRFERQGRRGRQLSRIESVDDFLRVGRGTIFGESKQRNTVVLTHVPVYNHELVDELVVAALEHRPQTACPSPDELYACSRVGETVDFTTAMEGFRKDPPGHLAIGSSTDMLVPRPWDIPPPILWSLSKQARWALMEGEVSVCHAVRLEALVGLERGPIRVAGVVELPGDIPYGYTLMVDGEEAKIAGAVVRDVIYWHETLNSAGQTLLGMAEQMLAILRDGDDGVGGKGQPDSADPQWSALSLPSDDYLRKFTARIGRWRVPLVVNCLGV
jgi:hypothetical protein